MKKNKLAGIIMILVSLFLWSINTSALRLIYNEHVDVMAITFLRNFVASVILLAFFLPFAKLRKDLFFVTKGNKRYLLLLSILFAVSTLTYVYAVAHTSIANVLLIADSSMIFTLIISFFWLKEKITILKILSIVLALIGLVIIILPGYEINLFSNQTLKGDLVALVNSVVWGAWYTVSRKLGKQVPAIATTTWSLVVTVFLLLPLTFPKLIYANISFKAWLLIISTAIGAQCVGTWLMHAATRRIEASIASLITPLEVIFGIFFGYILLKEIPHWYTYLGGCFIIVAIFIVAWSQKFSDKREN